MGDARAARASSTRSSVSTSTERDDQAVGSPRAIQGTSLDQGSYPPLTETRIYWLAAAN